MAGRRETSKSRGPRVLESDWIRTGLVTHRERESYGAIAGEGGTRMRAGSGNANIGGSPVVSMDAEKERGGRGWFFSNQATC